ncbi:cytochrome c3 family protein [bacterium]|nr:cytochrome c3 family protein [candidate division CSSED10-310 bacterium]
MFRRSLNGLKNDFRSRTPVRVSFLSAAVLIASIQAFGGQPDPKMLNPADIFKTRDLDCGLCHYCTEPTISEPCLYQCPRHKNIPTTDLKTPVDTGPDVVVLDTLEHLYEPARFNHKLHARMAEMSKGCTECHHYSPEGEYPACRECHKPGIPSDNLKQVGLKGAYHRQCIGCHREWSGETDCEVCHASKTGDLGSGEISKRHFPLVKPPGTIPYTTAFREGSTVRFDHKSHAEDYALQCQSCHRGSGCMPCHTQGRDMDQTDARKSNRGCLDCHGDMGCTNCHDVPQNAPPFDHSKTKFPLESYHAGLECKVCHDRESRHHGGSTECVSCHVKGWDPDRFDHAVTGFRLDETHRTFNCQECHHENRYRDPPRCGNCHDAEYRYPDVSPGKKADPN